MRTNNKKTGRISSRKVSRLIWVGMIVAVLALGATAAVSLRASHAKDSSRSTSRPSTGETKDATRAGMSFRVNGPIPIDPQTGQVRPLTQAEAQEMAAGIRELANQSTDGLQTVRHADGSVSMDLEGRFQNIAVAKREESGKLTQSCVDNPKSAAVFFEIDPQLVGAPADPNSPKKDSPLPMKGQDQ